MIRTSGRREARRRRVSRPRVCVRIMECVALCTFSTLAFFLLFHPYILEEGVQQGLGVGSRGDAHVRAQGGQEAEGAEVAVVVQGLRL